jgi:hypothetical protein
MYRPLHDLKRDASAPGPSAPEYAPYQYIDADGDGMIDSRIFELIDGTRIGNDVVLPAFPYSGPARLFAGVRIIDLSGLVNVNTATDFRTTPDDKNLAGLTPADVDLCRLLRLSDAWDLY